MEKKGHLEKLQKLLSVSERKLQLIAQNSLQTLLAIQYLAKKIIYTLRLRLFKLSEFL